jgi:hypothetical protein
MNDVVVVGVGIFGNRTVVMFGHVTVHDYTVLYFHPWYNVNLEQVFKYGSSRITFSVSCD